MRLRVDQARELAIGYARHLRFSLGEDLNGVVSLKSYADVLRCVRSGLTSEELKRVRFYDMKGVCRMDIRDGGGAR